MLPNCGKLVSVSRWLDRKAYPMYPTVSDLLGQLNGHEKPDLDISESLNGLAPLPGVAPDAGHVLSHTIDCLCTILSVEESRIRRRIRQEEVDERGPGDSDSAKDQEDCLPWCNTLHMAYGVGQDSSEDAGNYITHEPRSMAQRLFGAFVPHRNNHGQAWTNSRFCGSKKESDGKKPLCIEAGRGQHEDCAPDNAMSGQSGMRS